MTDTSNDYIRRVVNAAPFACNDAGIPEIVALIKALTAERDALQAEVKDMREALHKLSSDVAGTFAVFECGIRDVIGNTNYAVIMEFNGRARAILAKHKGAVQ